MFNSYADMVAALMCSVPTSYLQRPPHWSPEQYVSDRNIKLTTPDTQPVSGFFTDKLELLDLHTMYCKVIPAFKQSWEAAINAHYDRLTETQRIHQGIFREDGSTQTHCRDTEAWFDLWCLCRKDLGDMLGYAPSAEAISMIEKVGLNKGKFMRHAYVEIGPVRFTADLKEGEWAMARPPVVMQNADGEMITQPEFGRVQSIYELKGPDGKFCVAIKMQWFEGVEEGEDLYHPLLRTPLIGKKPRADRIDIMWLAQDLIPIRCWAARDYDVPARQIMLTRSWGILRHLGFPVQPYIVDPFSFMDDQ